MDIELKNAARRRFLLWYLIISLFFLFYCLHVAMAYDLYPDKGAVIPVLSAVVKAAARMTYHPFELYVTPSTRMGVFYGLLIPFIVGLMLFGNPKKTMYGKEHGSSRWGTKKEKQGLADPEDKRNMILTNDVKLDMDTRKTKLNNNVLVVGGSGSGKSRFVALPNIAQANCSYVITDPKGELLQKTGKLLEAEGYRVICFNLREKQHSCCYNPFHYIHKEEDIFKLVKQIIKSTKPEEGGSGNDPFWEHAETLFLQCCFFYTWLECPEEEQNLKTVMKLIGYASASEEDEERQSELDLLFEQLKEKRGSEHVAYKQYGLYKKAAGRTAKSILISAGARLSPFNIKEVENLILTDTLHLDEIGNRKTALYIVLPDSDTTFNFIASMLYTQLFDELYFQADFGEVKWENNKILYRSKESLYQKKADFLRIVKDMKETEGKLKRKELRMEMIKTLEDIEKEFGLPYPYFHETMTEKEQETYLHDLESCYLRLGNKQGTLKRYYSELFDLYQMLMYMEQSSIHKNDQEILKVRNKIDTYCLRIEHEFGLKARKNSGCNYSGNIKAYLFEVKRLLKELKQSEGTYGTRKSFEDKCKKIELHKERIKKYETLINEASFTQRKLKNKYRKGIQQAEKEIKRIETFAEYEFGIADLRSKKNNGRLPIHVRCILDEFANVPPPPDFEKLVATMRSREISVTIILQNIGQLKDMFKDCWESITGNCDSFLFLGGQEDSTLEVVNKKLGKMTIDKRTTGVTRSNQGSSSENWDNMGRDLMFVDEIQKVDTKYCILFIRGKPPFFCQKFHLEEHKRYGMIGDDGDNPLWMFDYRTIFITGNATKRLVNQVFFEDEVKKIIHKRLESIAQNLKKEKLPLSNDFSRENINILSGNQLRPQAANEQREVMKKRIMMQMEKLKERPALKITKISPDTLRTLIAKNVLEEEKKAVPEE